MRSRIALIRWHLPSWQPPLVVLTLCLLVGACDSDQLLDSQAQISANGGISAFDDAAPGIVNQRSVFTLNSRIHAASANGSEADLVIRYTLNDLVEPALRSATRIRVDLQDADGNYTLLSRTRLADRRLNGEIEVTVPVNAQSRGLRVSLDGLGANLVTDLARYSTITLPSVFEQPAIDLGKVDDVTAELVDGSYSSSVEGNRRLHRFAVRVEGTLNEAESELGLEAGQRVSVTGLEQNIARHFHALEYGFEDVESPVSANYGAEKLDVYLVMDVSSSITQAAAAHHLLDTVSRTVIALGRVANFNYRMFTRDVAELDSLRSIDFDLNDSGTALYRALDTALDDIENFGSNHQDKIIIAFTDGRDFSSRNFYPAFLSHEQVLDYITQRLGNVAQVQREYLNRRMELYMVGIGTDIDEQGLQSMVDSVAVHANDADSSDEGESGFFTAPNYTNVEINRAFAHLTNSIKGVYYLEYSSQQTPDDTDLVLDVVVNGIHADPVRLPTEYQLEYEPPVPQ